MPIADKQKKELIKLRALADIKAQKMKEILSSAIDAKTNVESESLFRARYRDIDNIKEEFYKLNSAIIDIVYVEEDETTTQMASCSNFDSDYFQAVALYDTIFARRPGSLLPSNVPANQSQSVARHSRTSNLPQLSIKKFDGNIKNFPTFLDMFNSMVHNDPDLLPVEKFNHLINCLEETPLSIIKLNITNDNYQIAYDTLVKRYYNERVLSETYWSAIENAPKTSTDDPVALRNLLDIFSENIDALETLKHPVKTWSFILTHLLLNKISSDTRTRFELQNSKPANVMPSYEDVFIFLEKQCTAFSISNANIAPNKNKITKKTEFHTSKNNNRSHRPHAFVSTNNSNAPQKITCPLCKHDHLLFKCPDFVVKPVKEKFEFVKSKRLCINCLSSLHKTSCCRSELACFFCRKRHHSLLCFTNNQPITQERETQNLPDKPVQANLVSGIINSYSSVLLATVQVRIQDKWGNLQTFRGLLDSGSQVSFITQKSARRLGLPINKSDHFIQGIGETQMNSTLGSLSFFVCPTRTTDPTFIVNAIIVSNICSDLPQSSIATHDKWDHLKYTDLADPKFFRKGPIDVLFGSDVYPYIIQDGRIEGPDNSPVAFKTVFGYVLMGKCADPPIKNCNALLCQLQEQSELNVTLQKFWESERIPEKISKSPDDILCEQKYSSTVLRNSQGRFTVTLPFLSNELPQFPNSYYLAEKRFLQLEKRLIKNSALYEEYKKSFLDYLRLDHMEILPYPVTTPYSYYISHHPVIKPDSLSTKLRIVFNASAKVNNISLNDTLLAGPKLQKDIVQVILKFRLHNVVLCCDIVKMFRMINLHPDHQDYQRVLFRFDPSSPILHFRIKTVLFGVTSSPYLALRTLVQLSEEEKNHFPRACKVLSEDNFVDDLITGSISVDDTLKLQDELTELLARGGFTLHKWSSNRPEVLARLPKDLINPASLSLDSDEYTKILGLYWHPSSDCFTYKISPQDNPATKRNILSQIAKFYDPTGLVAPVIFFTKHLIQQLWVMGLDWDEKIPDEIIRLWDRFKNELPLLYKFSLSRHIDTNDAKQIDLHGFCDASAKGFAAVVYITVLKNDTFTPYILISKSRVASIKTTSIPRLELNACLLLSELIVFVIKTYTYKVKFDNIYAWSDSTVALSWIKSLPYKWKTYVANRVSLIQERVDPANWHHIRTHENPADIASRGCLPSEILDNPLWWAGPDFLKFPRESWPPSKFHQGSAITEVEEEKRSNIAMQVIAIDQNFLDFLLEKYSSLTPLQRVIARVMQFLNNIFFCTQQKKGSLTYLDLHTALLILVKRVQSLAFPDIIDKVKSKQVLPKTFQKLSLFLDTKDNILRVGGRLHYSTLSYDKKHPALLPQKHKLTDLIIESLHLRYFHAGVQSVHYFLVQNFWILNAKRAIRRVLSKCVKCFRISPKNFQPQLGRLPSMRISQLKPFAHTGVDYAGPITLTHRYRGGKTFKGYIVYFICMSTKCSHLELVSDLTAEAFIAALRRFIARRGRVSCLYSDNALGFKKAYKDLIQMTKLSAESECIKWSWIPPSSPSFGGIWERGIRSVKEHLIRVIGHQILTYEEMCTVLCQIEAILNSRPLCPISNDANDLTVLTPGHFLTLEPLSAAPDDDLSHLKLNHLNRWQLLQRLQQDFWTRWHREYLHNLQARAKWLTSEGRPEIGQIVVIKDEQTHPLKWRLARIAALYPGPDGVDRVASVQTANGVLKRPVLKLCPLPISTENA